MARVALGLAVVALAALVGCGDPIPAHQSPVLLAPQVEMTSDSLANDTAVTPPVINRIFGTGQLTVSVQVENRTDSPMVLEYQYEFLSKGAQKEPWTGWMPLRIPARADGTASFQSLGAELDDFRLRFRRAQVN